MTGMDVVLVNWMAITCGPLVGALPRAVYG